MELSLLVRSLYLIIVIITDISISLYVYIYREREYLSTKKYVIEDIAINNTKILKLDWDVIETCLIKPMSWLA